MFVYATHDIVRHAEIKRAMLSAREKIDVVGHRGQPGLWIPGSMLRIAPE